jgi:hypothetical protein
VPGHSSILVTGIGQHDRMALSESLLLSLAGDLVYARAEDYLELIEGLELGVSSAHASVQGAQRYTVALDWSGPLPDGSCTCPHHGDGNFCKHLVAVGLAAIDSGQVSVDDAAEPALQAVVEAMDAEDLRELVLALAHRDAGVRRLLEVRALTDSGGDGQASAELLSHARNALAFGGFVYYNESYGVAEAATEVLDELEHHLMPGGADIARPALRLAVTRLRSIVEEADDSSGVISDQCQRAADLYAQSCRLGRPDPAELANWLVTFRASSPGWPTLSEDDLDAAWAAPTVRAGVGVAGAADEGQTVG